MSRIKKLTGNTLILGIGTVSSKLLVFLLMPLYTALLTTEQFGTAELITSCANLLIPIAGVGVTNAIFRFTAEKSSNKERVLSSGVFLLLAGFFLFLALSPLLSLVGYLDGYVWLVLLYVLFANLQSIAAQYVRAMDRTGLFAFQGIFNTLMTVLSNILLLAVFRMSVVGYVLSVIIGNLLTLIFLFCKARLWRVIRLSSVDKGTILAMLRFGLPLVPTTVCWLITDLSDRYMVNYFCSTAVTGIYSAAYKIPTVITLASGVFMQAWQLSAVAESSDEESCKSFYGQVFSGFLSLVAIGGGALILLVRPLTHLLLDESYFEAWRYMPTLIAAAVLEALVSFLATVYLVRKKTLHSFFTAVGGCLLNVLLNLWLIPMNGWYGGALGAAIATLASYAFVLLLRVCDVPRLLRFRLYGGRMLASVLLLFGEVALLTLEVPHAMIYAILLAVAVFAVNVQPLWVCARRLLQFRRGKC